MLSFGCVITENVVINDDINEASLSLCYSPMHFTYSSRWMRWQRKIPHKVVQLASSGKAIKFDELKFVSLAILSC